MDLQASPSVHASWDISWDIGGYIFYGVFYGITYGIWKATILWDNNENILGNWRYWDHPLTSSLT
jgi:hypothetical protein